jgi:acyl carrier protein
MLWTHSAARRICCASAALPKSQLLGDVLVRNKTVDETERLQNVLLGLWKVHLEIAPRTIDESFFDLGGTSISAMIIGLEFSESENLELDPSAMFELETIRAIVDELTGEGAIPSSA